MTRDELEARARQRAIAERLHTFKIAGEPVYLVRSRQTEPGAMHRVRIDPGAGAVTSCSCAGWFHRQTCTHAAAVSRRLEREGKIRSAPAREPLAVESRGGRSQLFREEASA